MKDCDVLFKALVARRQAIHNLLVSTSTLSEQLTALIRQTRADLKPALTHLDSVVEVLNKNQDNLDRQPAADGAVLPRVRQHARQRAVVRHLHPEPAPGPAGGG